MTNALPPDQDRADIVILPPMLLALTLGLGAALDALLPLQVLAAPDWWSAQMITGLVLTAAGGALDLIASGQFLGKRTNILPGQPSLHLVTGGIYRLTRNPMYVGLIAILVGLSLIFALEWGLIVSPLMAAILHFGVVKREESYLLSKFGTPYQDFVNRTRRWLI